LHLRGGGKDLYDLPDNALRSDHAEIAADLIPVAAVDEQRVGT
jgi:hypothetical protein